MDTSMDERIIPDVKVAKLQREISRKLRWLNAKNISLDVQVRGAWGEDNKEVNNESISK